MKTYPILRGDGGLQAFEIGRTWTSLRTVARVLRSVRGVSNVRSPNVAEKRLLFDFNDSQCEVWEPFGDNSRYWIGPSDGATCDIAPLHDAFARHTHPIVRTWHACQRLMRTRGD